MTRTHVLHQNYFQLSASTDEIDSCPEIHDSPSKCWNGAYDWRVQVAIASGKKTKFVLMTDFSRLRSFLFSFAFERNAGNKRWPLRLVVVGPASVEQTMNFFDYSSLLFERFVLRPKTNKKNYNHNRANSSLRNQPPAASLFANIRKSVKM